MFLFLISEFLIETGKNPEFEKYNKTELCQELRALYAGLRTKKGQYYSKSAYINIRSGLNRYLTSPPNSFEINLMRDREFMHANQVFSGVLRKLKEDGHDTTKH